MKRNQTLNERQREMLSTCMESCQNVAYPFMALIEEVGELAEKVYDSLEWKEGIDTEEKHLIDVSFKMLIAASKFFRTFSKGIRHGAIEQPFSIDKYNINQVSEISYEIGDVEWDLNVFAHYLGIDAQNIADLNYYKLKNRQRRNEIDGNGDHERTAIE